MIFDVKPLGSILNDHVYIAVYFNYSSILMVSKEEAKRFLSKINPFVQKLPDIAEKISKLADDKEFQNLLGRREQWEDSLVSGYIFLIKL